MVAGGLNGLGLMFIWGIEIEKDRIDWMVMLCTAVGGRLIFGVGYFLFHVRWLLRDTSSLVAFLVENTYITSQEKGSVDTRQQARD